MQLQLMLALAVLLLPPALLQLRLLVQPLLMQLQTRARIKDRRRNWPKLQLNMDSHRLSFSSKWTRIDSNLPSAAIGRTHPI